MADTVPSAAQMKQALGGRPPRQKKKPNVLMGVFPPVANTHKTTGQSPFLHVMGVLQAVGVITGPADDTDQTTGQSSKKGKAPRTTGQSSKKGKAPRTTGKSSKKAPRTTKKSSFLNAMAAAAPAVAPAAATTQTRERPRNDRGPRISDADGMAMLNSHMPTDAPELEGDDKFKGGNLKKSKVNINKEISVQLNEHGVALYKLNPRYTRLTERLRKTIQDVGKDVEVTGLNHPYLNFSSMMISEKDRDALAADLFPNSANFTKKKKRFGQFLCSHGIKSHQPSGSSDITWKFYPKCWNRVGFRLTKGGDGKGGKPQVKFEP